MYYFLCILCKICAKTENIKVIFTFINLENLGAFCLKSFTVVVFVNYFRKITCYIWIFSYFTIHFFTFLYIFLNFSQFSLFNFWFSKINCLKSYQYYYTIVCRLLLLYCHCERSEAIHHPAYIWMDCFGLKPSQWQKPQNLLFQIKKDSCYAVSFTKSCWSFAVGDIW